MPLARPPTTSTLVKAYGHIKHGVFYLADKRSFERALQTQPDGPAVFILGPETEARTASANGHYFGTVLREIAAQRNANESPDPFFTTEALHAYYKEKFNGGASTTALPPRTFSIYVERVMADAAQEHGVEFPEPTPLLAGAR